MIPGAARPGCPRTAIVVGAIPAGGVHVPVVWTIHSRALLDCEKADSASAKVSVIVAEPAPPNVGAADPTSP